LSKRTQTQSQQELTGTRANGSTLLPTVANKNKVSSWMSWYSNIQNNGYEIQFSLSLGTYDL